MDNDSIKIWKIVNNVSKFSVDSKFADCWVKDQIKGIEVDDVLYSNISNFIFFWDNKVQWKIYTSDDALNAGYLLQLSNEVLMNSCRHALKFTNKTIKEISYDLGFSTPDYFSYFFKNQTGTSPSVIRKCHSSQIQRI